LQFSPKWSGNLSAQWYTPISQNVEFRLRANLLFTDRFFTAQDEDPFTAAEGYTKLNMRVAIAHADGTWEVAVVAKNLTDQRTPSWINDITPNVLGNSSQASFSYYARSERGRASRCRALFVTDRTHNNVFTVRVVNHHAQV
ncbi:MAG: TonB-dependent receptor, partial [Pseudomonadales bacterium]|nr:TonB-dependent receptor [Pseudomonadales bacterium]